jgi:hypothetical protein
MLAHQPAQRRRLPAIAAALMSFYFSSCAFGAPLVLKFEADVTDVQLLYPHSLPFEVQVGDILRGALLFDPVDVSADVRYTTAFPAYRFDVSVNSVILSTGDYSLTVRDDLPLLDSPGYTDDILIVASGAGFNLSDPHLPPSTDIDWRVTLHLVGDGSILEGADVPQAADIWNGFAPTYLSLAFEIPGVADVLRVNATVRSFAVVPEPSGAALLIIQCVFLKCFTHSETLRPVFK